MARQQKKGIQYFSMDTDIYADRKIRRIQSKCGPLAMSVITKILCHIYGEEGYFALADDDFVFDVADELGVDTALVRGVIAACVDGGFFDKALHAQYGILTSARVQRNYIAATRRRAFNREINEAYRLCAASECTLSSTECTQRKENQTKENQNTLNQTKPLPTEKAVFAEFVTMTQDEHEALVSRYGKDAAVRMIEILDDYKGAHGREYENDYRAIRTWVVRRYNEEQAQAAQLQPKRESFERGTENYDHLAEDLFEDDGQAGDT